MYHSRFVGNPFDAGFRWGAALLKRGAHIDGASSLYRLTRERRDFADKCLKIYEKYLPTVTAELRGIAAGQKMPAEDLYAFLFGMYCFTSENHCTCLALKTETGALLARNSDFLPSLEKLYDSCFYRLSGKYAFVGNTTAFTETEDGVNEYGFAAGLTFVPPRACKPGLNAGMLVRYLLENCKTTDEAISALKELPISSAQTLTLADKTGEIAVAECDSENVAIVHPNEGENFVVAVNGFYSESFSAYPSPEPSDNWNSDLRRETALRALGNNGGRYALNYVKDLLSGKFGFMCQYDGKEDKDTVWSTVYELSGSGSKIYRAEGNPSRKAFREDTRLKFR